MTELLFAEKESAFEDLGGILVSSPSPLSLTKVMADGNAESVISFLESHPNKRVISDTDASNTDGFYKKEYTLFTLDKLIPPKSVTGFMKEGASGKLLALMFRESANIILPSDLTEGFEKNKANDTFLWHDDGICAMARVAFRGKNYARINTVVTAEDKRGKGYASTLVYNVCSALIGNGLTATVLADMKNPISCKMYSSLGFIPYRSVYEYIPKNKAVIETALTSSSLTRN